MLPLVETFAVTHPYWVYFIIALGALIEGPFLSIFCWALLAIGYLYFPFLLLSLVIGNILGDILWYAIGYGIGPPFIFGFGKYLGLKGWEISKIRSLFIKHQYRILFLSKISNGFGLAIGVLFVAGLSRTPFVRFLWIGLLGEIIWSGSLVAIGYVFSTSLIHSQGVFHKIWLSIGLGTLVCVFFLWRKYLRSAVLNESNTGDTDEHKEHP